MLSAGRSAGSPGSPRAGRDAGPGPGEPLRPVAGGAGAGLPEADPAGAGPWLRGFAISHAKREHAAVEVVVEEVGGGEAPSFRLRLALGDLVEPPGGGALVEVTRAEVASGRGRFAWCEDMARRLRAGARRLIERAGESGRA